MQTRSDVSYAMLSQGEGSTRYLTISLSQSGPTPTKVGKEAKQLWYLLFILEFMRLCAMLDNVLACLHGSFAFFCDACFLPRLILFVHLVSFSDL